MCKAETRTLVNVHVASDIAFEGREIHKLMPIDSCIAEPIRALDAAGLRMLSSCCGHGNGFGHIALTTGEIVWFETLTVGETND